jgi:hypothetical protein
VAYPAETAVRADRSRSGTRPERRISCCHHVDPIYTEEVRFNWKSLRLAIFAAILALAAGCSGFSGSYGVSPATFLLPGLMQADPPPKTPEAETPPTVARGEFIATSR